MTWQDWARVRRTKGGLPVRALRPCGPAHIDGEVYLNGAWTPYRWRMASGCGGVREHDLDPDSGLRVIQGGCG